MSAEVEELAKLLQDASKAPCPIAFWSEVYREPTGYGKLFAGAILDAGYARPRKILTVDELDALPVGSVVIDRGGVGEVYRKLARHGGVKWYEPSYAIHWESHELNFPVLVIWDARP